MKLDQILAAARPILAAVAGAAATFGAIQVTDPNIILTGFDHIVAGVKEIGIGVGILTPFALAAWGSWRASTKQQVASVNASAPTELVKAVQSVAPHILVNAAAETPGVAKIVATTEIVNATTSDKVVSR